MGSVKKRSSAFHKYSQIVVPKPYTQFVYQKTARKFGLKKSGKPSPEAPNIRNLNPDVCFSPPYFEGKVKEAHSTKSTKGTFPLYLSCPLPIGLFFFLLRLVGDWALGASPGFWASPPLPSSDSNEAIRFWGMGKKKKKEAGGHSGFCGWSPPCSAKDVSFICCVGVKFPEFSLFSLPPPLSPPSRENAIKALDLGFWWTSTLDGCVCV